MKTNTTNLVLVFAGLALVAAGLYRQSPIKPDRAFIWNIAPMAGMFSIIATLIYFYNQALVTPSNTATIFEKGVDASMKISANYFFTIVLLMPLIAFSTALTPVFEKGIESLLGKWYGWLCVFPLSFISAGGSGFSGVVKQMWKSEMLRPLLLYFLSVTPLTAFSIFQIRSLGIGSEIANQMYRMNWLSAVWLMPMYLIYAKFFFKA